MEKIKLAIFDVDGTLFDGNLGILMLKNLLKKNLFDAKYGAGILNWFQKYKDGSVEKSVVVDEIYKLYTLGMIGQNEKEINSVADLTWDEVKDKTFSFTPTLLKKLKNQNYTIILISGSNSEIIHKFGTEYGVGKNNIIAGEIETVNGIYTGKLITYPGNDAQKETLLKKLIETKKWDVDWDNSVAMGNNERDKRLLSLCGIAIAMEPNDVLENEAKRNGWIIANRNTILNLRFS